MFDRTVVFGRGGGTHHHNHNVKVEEKKAPTDESMRLLDEFRKEASSSIIEHAMVKLEPINGEIMYMRQRHHTGFGEIIKYKVNLNGKEFINEFELDPYKQQSLDRVGFVVLLRDEVVNFMITELTIQLVNKGR